MKSDELQLAHGLLQKLKEETDRLDALMDQLLTEMENAPPEKRSHEAWDAFAKKFSEMQRRQRAIGERLLKANIALENSDPTAKQ